MTVERERKEKKERETERKDVIKPQNFSDENLQLSNNYDRHKIHCQ